MTDDDDPKDLSRAERLQQRRQSMRHEQTSGTGPSDNATSSEDPDQSDENEPEETAVDSDAPAREASDSTESEISLDAIDESNGTDVDALRTAAEGFLDRADQAREIDRPDAARLARQAATLLAEIYTGSEEYAPTVRDMIEDVKNALSRVLDEPDDSETGPNLSVLEEKLDLFVGDDLLNGPDDFPSSPESPEPETVDPTPDNDSPPAEETETASHEVPEEDPEQEPEQPASEDSVEDETSPSEDDEDAGYRFDAWDPAGKEVLLEDYLAESREGLEKLTNALIELEEQPSSDRIDEVFRVAHTLKGSSGMVGLEVMEELAHSMEELLDEVRDGSRDVTAEMIDLLLICNDKIEEILDDVAQKEPVQVRVGHLLDGLEGFRAGEDVDLEKIRQKEESSGESDSDDEEDDDSGESAVTETIRVGTDKLDRVINLVGELTINKQQFDNSIKDIDQIEREISRLVDSADQLVNENNLDTDLVEELRLIHGAIRDLDQDVEQASKEISRVNTNLQDAVMQTRMVPIAQLFQKFPRQVRDLARTEGKEVDFETRGDDTEMDKTVIEKIGDPLMHIIRNAIDHGIEPPEERTKAGKPEEGKLVIEAGYEGDLAVIEIRDDGQGILPDAVKDKAIENGVITEAEAEELTDQEAQELVFEPGFSTTEEVTETSGRGVGMDVVRSNITDLNGQVELDSTVGEGSTFTIKLPLTLAIVQVLQVRCGQEQLALPLSSIRETLRISTDRIDEIGHQEVFELRGSTLTLLRLSDVLQISSRRRNHQDIYPVIVAEWGDRKVGILVDEMLEKQEVVIKDLGSVLKNVPFNSGATISGDGQVVLIVDLGRIVQQADELSSETAQITRKPENDSSTSGESRARVLVVDDSSTARTMITEALEGYGYEVEEAKDGREALEIVKQDDSFDLISTDIKMPHVEGYEFVRELRTMDDYRHTPVVMVSSRDTRIDKMRGFEVGADDYLEKPFNPEEALDTFENLLEGASNDSATR